MKNAMIGETIDYLGFGEKGFDSTEFITDGIDLERQIKESED